MLRGMKQQPQRKTTKTASDRSTATSLRHRKIKCVHCSKFFHGPQGLSAHVRTAHRQGQQLDKALKDRPPRLRKRHHCSRHCSLPKRRFLQRKPKPALEL